MRSILAGLRSLVLPWGASAQQPRIVMASDLPPNIAHLTAAVLWYAEDPTGTLVGHYYGIGPGTVNGAVIERGFFPTDTTDPAFTRVVDKYSYDPTGIIPPSWLMSFDVEGNGALVWNGQANFTSLAKRPIIGDHRVYSGEQNVIFVTMGPSTSWTRSVSFTNTFSANPNIAVTIDSGAMVTENWTVKVFGVSSSGFSIWGTGPSATWNNVKVMWTAFAPL